MKSKSIPTKSDSKIVEKKNIIWFLSICIILTIITFFPVFNAGFVNWDDDFYVYKNSTIQSIHNFQEIVSEPVQGNFHPLTMLSLAIDYWISGGNAKWFHFINVLIHLANVVLVFFFIYKLTNQKKWVALITALLFAIHPLHVESVAWISERKDLLYSCFFLSGLILYLNYLKNNRVQVLSGVFLLFLLSLLSKPAAIVFPLVLLAIDFYFNRLKQTRTYVEKIPFVVFSLIFAVIALHTQKTAGAYVEDSIFLPFTTRLLFGSYGILMYLFKMIIPVNLCAFYPFPELNKSLPAIYYLSLLFALALLVLFVISIKRKKEIAFAIIFYIINLILVLQLLPIGRAVMADRYSYIPLLGPFFLIGLFVQRNIDRKNGEITFSKGLLLAIVILVLVIFSRKQVSTWKDGGTLWDQAIKVCPSSKAYALRGIIYKNEGNTKLALEMLSRSINMNKFKPDPLINRGNIFFDQKQYRLAIRDYSNCLAIDPKNDKAFANRGAAYLAIGIVDSAEMDLNRAIELNPSASIGYKNRGMLFLLTGQYQYAINDYLKYMQIVPDVNGDIWNKIGYSYQQLGDHKKAIEAFSNAIKISENGTFYYLRALSLYKLGNISMAQSDVRRAIAMGVKIDPELLKSLGLNAKN